MHLKKLLYLPCTAVIGSLWFVSFAHSPFVSTRFLALGETPGGPMGLGYSTLLVLMIINAIFFGFIARSFWVRLNSIAQLVLSGFLITIFGGLSYCLLIVNAIIAVAVFDGSFNLSQLGDLVGLFGTLFVGTIFGFLFGAAPILVNNFIFVTPMALLTPLIMRWVAVE